ncbi:MAG: hypothetical protein DRI44_05830 [Chlamydiae bacterium]|nr:MAG: hypothetical protein DRI44_05830 [Chlamydiota bacterium]
MSNQKSKSKIINSIPTFTMSLHESKIQNGIALVAVLAILVVLAIMAASFTALMNIENKQSRVQMNSQQLDMLVGSGLEQAKAIITIDEMKSSADKSYNKQLLTSPNIKNSYSKWMFVKDSEGKICGRYRFRIEDESSKVNINKAFLLKNGKGTGWDTGEINLPHALGVPRKTAKKLIDYRYGKNKLPGSRGDDDQNNLILMADGIDNNANGVIDEEDEGINDPKEYSAEHLKGDDSKFSSMTELINVIMADNKKLSANLKAGLIRELPRRATIYSIDKPGSPTLRNDIPSDINSITPRECRKLLIRANSDMPFEPNSAKQMQLAANLIDYRDENHVLSTLGSTYGVEAICFNEILANDESYAIDPLDGAVPRPYSNSQWKERFGSTDGKRMFYRVDTIYDCVPDDPMMPSGQYYYNLDPRRGWRIRNQAGKVPIGGITRGGSIILKMAKVIGKKGNTGNADIKTYYKQKPPIKLPGGKSWCHWPSAGANVYTFGSESQYEKFYNEIIKVLRKVNSADGNRPKFPKNYFKNSWAMVYGWSDNPVAYNPKPVGCFKITTGDQSSLTIQSTDINSGNKFATQLSKVNFSDGTPMSFDNCDLSVTINSWGDRSPFAMVPEANVTYLMRSRRPIAGKYFKITIGRPPRGRFTQGYPNELGVSGAVGGDFTDDKDYLREWVYNNGKPVKTKSGGWVKIMLTSSPKVSRAKKIRQWLSYFRMIAPEVVEMYNASATPISLANWRVICNTGSLATQIGRIHSTSYYDQKLRRGITDDNPVVQPRGHFYLVNDTGLFDGWYGNGDNKWGSRADEQVPVFQMDEQNWGVAYKIKKTHMDYPPSGRAGYSIIIDERNLDKEIFNLETVKFVDKDGADDPDSWNNVYAPVVSDLIREQNEIFLAPVGRDTDIITGKLVGKSIMILGLPHGGGIVSLTLKNEYDQVCARTVDYGKVDVDELDVSTEKIDPTKTTWVKRKKTSIGGTENEAENRAMKTHHNDKFFIKNGPFCSIGEARNISTGNDFERLGGSGDISKGANALAALSKYMSSSNVRLESCLGDVTRVGWNQAYDEVAGSSLTSVKGKVGGWKKDKWVGHTLRFLTGPLRGEKYPIISNSKNTILLAQKNSKYVPRSAPNRKAVKPNIGNKFTIGPGYATPMCYTRKSGESATWTWKNAIAYPGTYDLYIYGLNDAIDTTEFLEENNNASIDVEIWNYKIKKFNRLKKRGQYGKQDSFNAGKIKPENISGDGNIKIRLTAHNVIEQNTDDNTGKVLKGTGGKQTGIAWFNYAIVTPVPVPGRVNINTAPPRLLASLPGINTALAENIYAGLNSNGKKILKPYKTLGDLFKVKGMTPDIFERCVNILDVDSSAFTVEVEAQILKNKKMEKNDKLTPDSIIASRKKRFVVEADKKEGRYLNISEIESYPVR